jgi:hypothetical protein
LIEQKSCKDNSSLIEWLKNLSSLDDVSGHKYDGKSPALKRFVDLARQHLQKVFSRLLLT